MLHLKSSEGKQLACWEIMSFSASDSNFFPHPSSTYLATPSLCTALDNNWRVIVRNLFFNIFAHYRGPLVSSWLSVDHEKKTKKVSISPLRGEIGSALGAWLVQRVTAVTEFHSVAQRLRGWAGVTFCFSGFTASGFVSVIAWKLGNLHWCAADISSPQLGQEGSLPGLPVFTNSTLLRDTVHLSCLFTFGTFWNFTNFNWNFESFLDFGWKQGVQVDGVN